MPMTAASRTTYSAPSDRRKLRFGAAVKRALAEEHGKRTEQEQDRGQLRGREEGHDGRAPVIRTQIFDEEAEGEDVEEAESEEESCAYEFVSAVAVGGGGFAVAVTGEVGPYGTFLWGGVGALVDVEHDEDEDGVGYGFVELSWMAWEHIDTLEDECPWHVGRLADDLRVHEVSEAYEACGDRCGDGYDVDHEPHGYFLSTVVYPQGKHKTECSAVACQSFVADELPVAQRQ